MARSVVALLFVVTFGVLSTGTAWTDRSYNSEPEIRRVAKDEFDLGHELDTSVPLTAGNVPRPKLGFSSNLNDGLTASELNLIVKLDGERGRNAVRKSILEWVAERDKILKDTTKAQDKGTRASRGKHLINNGVTGLYKDIIVTFLRSKGFKFDPNGKAFNDVFRTDLRNEAISATLNNIENVLKVHIPRSQHYVDTNAKIYGYSTAVLKELALKHMTDLYNYNPRTLKTQWTSPFEEAIELMVRHEIYVDKEAVKAWEKELEGKSKSGGKNGPNEKKVKKEMYNTALSTVKRIFINLKSKVAGWVRKIRNARPSAIDKGANSRGSKNL